MPINFEIQQAELQHRIDELSGTVERLQREVEQVRERDAVQQSGSRRDLLKVVGGVAAGVLVGSGVGPSPAHANTSDAMLVGNTMGATNMTRIRNGNFTTTPGNSLTSDATMMWVDTRLSTLTDAHGLRGDGKGANGAGLWGQNDSGGIGVLGNGGPGVWGNGSIGVRASGSIAAVILMGAGGSAPSNPAPPARVDAAHGRRDRYRCQWRRVVVHGERHAWHVAQDRRAEYRRSVPRHQPGTRLRHAILRRYSDLDESEPARVSFRWT